MSDISKLLPKKPVRLYKQAGVIARYQGTVVACWVHTMNKYFKNTYGDVWMFWDKNENALWVFQEEPMHVIAGEFIERSKNGFPAGFAQRWATLQKSVEAYSREISSLHLPTLSLDELERHYLEMLKRHGDMWALSIFIDSFDAGDDQREIARIVAEHSFTPGEVEILATPHTPSYATAWEQALWCIKQGALSAHNVAHEYFWIRTDYHFFDETDAVFVGEAAQGAHEVSWVSTNDKEQKILAAYGMRKNPLAVFQTLTQWRDDRKRINYVGFYGLMRILSEVGKRRGIEHPYVRNLLVNEAETLFTNEATSELKDKVRTRFDAQTFIYVDDAGRLAALDGTQALDAYQRLLDHMPRMEGTELKGTVASRGVVHGIVRVVPGPESPSAKEFKQGDILVTSMTRPEFMPLMKLCGAIVTDEGGITSHAAIVSRELHKPCIIGTKHASQVLKDGDLVEVDAEKGIVKKLN